MKKCNRCLIEKKLTEFFREKGNKSDGRYGMCKECKTQSTLESRARKREEYNTYMREYRKEHPLSEKARMQNIERTLRCRYSIGLKDRADMLKQQKHACAICGRKEKTFSKPLVVDHNHHTKQTRGLLCHSCNRSLHVLEDKRLLENAVEYLKSYEG